MILKNPDLPPVFQIPVPEIWDVNTGEPLRPAGRSDRILIDGGRLVILAGQDPLTEEEHS